MLLRFQGCRGVRRRPAYTLLEVLLASTIGVLLMGALYVAVNVQLRHAHAGREVIEQSTLVRALLNRIGGDINSSLGPQMPVLTSSSGGGMGGGGGGAAGGGTSGAAGSTGSSSTTAASGTGGSGTGGTGSTGSSSSSSAPAANAVQFNLGVQGDSTHLVLYVSRVARDLNWNPDASNTNGQPVVSDQRRITYWLAGEGSSPLGLAREEIKPVTSSDALANVPPNIPDEASHVIAEEVKSLTFSYFDGTNWQDTWDGTQPGTDGTTPQGPPLLIAIVVGVAPPGSKGQDNLENLKTYRHVVAIHTANGLPQQTTNNQ